MNLTQSKKDLYEKALKSITNDLKETNYGKQAKKSNLSKDTTTNISN